jgi:hypothetical protein
MRQGNCSKLKRAVNLPASGWSSTITTLSFFHSSPVELKLGAAAGGRAIVQVTIVPTGEFD